jgi:hypothetical protein
MIILPFADDIRDLTIDPVAKASPDQILKAKQLIKTLRIKFDSRNFENPGKPKALIDSLLFKALQKHYASLQVCAC